MIKLDGCRLSMGIGAPEVYRFGRFKTVEYSVGDPLYIFINPSLITLATLRRLAINLQGPSQI